MAGEVQFPTVDVFYRSLTAQNPAIVASPLMLFPFCDVRSQIELVLQNWFKKSESLKPVFDLYFSTLYASTVYIESEFLSLIQAVESYHRRTRTNVDSATEAHDERVRVILEKVPEEHKEWLSAKLAHSNEPTLRKRLSELLEEFSDVMEGHIPHNKKFIARVVDTRNYLTHYDLEAKERSAYGTGFFDLNQCLRLLLTACLLRELEFSIDDIKKRVSKSRIARLAYLA